MADKVYIGQEAEAYHSSPEKQYSRVTIVVGNDEDGSVIAYTAGDDTKDELLVECPWGTQTMANALLSALAGYKYKPYSAEGTYTHPAAELGDAVTVGDDIYGGIYVRDTEYSVEPISDLSAPTTEEIDDEYDYEEPIKRELKRRIINGDTAVKASITVELGEIRLEVAGKIDANDAQSQIQQTLNNITLSVTDGTQANTSKFIISGTGISAVSDNITLKANSINLSNANVSGYLNVAQNIQAGAITARKLATNAIQSQNYSGVWTPIYDGSDGLDHDAEDYAVRINGVWYKFEAGVPLGDAEGSYDAGIVADMARMKFKIYTISTKAIHETEYSFSTISTITDEEELPLSASFGFTISGSFLDLANGDFHATSMDITSSGARFKGNLDNCKLRNCEGYTESYTAAYSGSGVVTFNFDEDTYRTSVYAGADHYFTFHEDDVGDVGWYDEDNNYIDDISDLGVSILDTPSEGDVLSITYEAGYSKVITLQDLKDLGLIS